MTHYRPVDNGPQPSAITQALFGGLMETTAPAAAQALLDKTRRDAADRAAVLFRPFAMKDLYLANRVVMAPLTRRFSPGGVPGPDVAAYYRRKARGGVGLILTEATVIGHAASANDPNVPRFHGADALAGWAHVVAEVHSAGGRIMPQLWHVGMVPATGEPVIPAHLVGPSGMLAPGRRVAAPMTEAQVEAVVSAYARAATDAQRLGFDGVEIHGAHGYLIDQFFWAATNRRSDRFGGSMLGRTRFAAQIVETCRRAVGPNFPILMRLSQWKIQDYTARLASSADLLAQFLEPLVDAGVDLFDLSTRRFWQPEFPDSPLNLAGWTKKLTGKPVMTIGSVGLHTDFTAAHDGIVAVAPIDRVIEMLAREEVDLVGVGRALLADPAWVTKIREGRFRELSPYSSSMLSVLS